MCFCDFVVVPSGSLFCKAMTQCADPRQHIFFASLASRCEWRVSVRVGTWCVLPWVLLGVDGCAFCRGHDEPAMDRRVTLFVFLEKVLPFGVWGGRLAGGGLLVMGLVVLASSPMGRNYSSAPCVPRDRDFFFPFEILKFSNSSPDTS